MDVPSIVTNVISTTASSPSPTTSLTANQGPVNNQKRLIIIIVVCVGGFALILLLVLVIVPFARRRLDRKRRHLGSGDAEEANGFGNGSGHQRMRSGPDSRMPLLNEIDAERGSGSRERDGQGNGGRNPEIRIGERIKWFDEENDLQPRHNGNIEFIPTPGAVVDVEMGKNMNVADAPPEPSPASSRFGDITSPRPIRALRPPPVLRRSRTRVTNPPMTSLPENYTTSDITPAAAARSPSPTTTTSGDTHAHLTSPSTSSDRFPDDPHPTWLHIPNLPPARRLISAFQSSLSSISSGSSARSSLAGLSASSSISRGRDHPQTHQTSPDGTVLPPMRHYPSYTTNSKSPATSFYSLDSGSVADSGVGVGRPPSQTQSQSNKRDTFGNSKSRGGAGDGTFGSRERERAVLQLQSQLNGTGGTNSTGNAGARSTTSGSGGRVIGNSNGSGGSRGIGAMRITELGELQSLKPPSARLRSQMPDGEGQHVTEVSEDAGFLLPPSRQASFLSGPGSASSLGVASGGGGSKKGYASRSATSGGSRSVYSDARSVGFSDS